MWLSYFGSVAMEKESMALHLCSFEEFKIIESLNPNRTCTLLKYIYEV